MAISRNVYIQFSRTGARAVETGSSTFGGQPAGAHGWAPNNGAHAWGPNAAEPAGHHEPQTETPQTP
jgi:hypothetical protein